MIIPTILEIKKENILDKINLINGKIPHFQIDIVDKTLFDGETFMETGYIDEINLNSTLELDLMVKNPIEYLNTKIKNVIKVVANISGENISDFLRISGDIGYIKGISVNPDNTLEHYHTFIEQIDFIQFMGVNPGGQGREFDKKVLENVKSFKDGFPDIPVQVDGGIKMDNVKDLLDSGVNSLVIGSAIFNNENPVIEYNNFKEEFNRYERRN